MLYPVNGLRKIVDPHKKPVRYEMVTDMGARRISKREAERLMDEAQRIGRDCEALTSPRAAA